MRFIILLMILMINLVNVFSNDIFSVSKPIDEIQYFLDELCNTEYKDFKIDFTNILDLNEFVYLKYGCDYLCDLLELYYIANNNEWFPGYSFSNPFEIAIKYEDTKLANKLWSLDKNLLFMPSYLSGFRDDTHTMFEMSVILGKHKILKHLYSIAGQKFIKWSYQSYEISVDGVLFLTNPIGLTYDQEIRKYLIELGIPYEIEYEQFEASCIDNKVRIRTKPFLDAEVLGVINLGDIITVIGNSTFTDSIDDARQYHWIKIKYKSIVGWCYSKYFDIRYAQPK